MARLNSSCRSRPWGMCTLSRVGFDDVIGVELSGEMIEIARRNAARRGATVGPRS